MFNDQNWQYPCIFYYYDPYYYYQDQTSPLTPPSTRQNIILKDYGPNPLVLDIEDATEQNTNFRTTLWTGKHLQVTLMSIGVGGEIGLEMHPDVDQFIRFEEGEGYILIGDEKDNYNYQTRVFSDFIFIIPAGKWHNVVNTGQKPLKLYSIYAPPQHPKGTVHQTKAESDAAGNH